MCSCKAPLELISAVTQDQRSLLFLAVMASQQTRVGSKQVSRLEKRLAHAKLYSTISASRQS